MEIVVKGRHCEVPERFRQHAIEKLSKLERFDHKEMRLDVELCHEHNRRQSDVCERIELTFHSRGPVIRAEAAADDPYAALDIAATKLEQRLRRLADRRRVHRGRRTPVSVAAATAAETGSQLLTAPPGVAEVYPTEAPTTATDEQPNDELDLERVAGVVPPELLGMDGDGPLVVREKVHRASPMTIDQALFEMELVGHDFFLFCDKESRMPSVVYRRRGYDYGVIRLETSEEARHAG